MVALKEALAKLKLKLNVLKMSKFAWITTIIVAIFAVSIAAASYYYYIVPQPTHLRILYTHPDSMVTDVVNDFKEWYEGKYGRPIEVTLTSVDPQSAYETVTNPYSKPEAEIWWGGSLSLFEKASDNLLPYNSTQKSEINATVYSCSLMDLNQSTPRWYAANLYALGVMYNTLEISKPQNWTSLLGEGNEGNMTMVDPTESDFTQPFIMLVIQSQNWTEGWNYLVNISAFVRGYDTNEATSVLKVASGYLPIAIVPDFYAYDRMAIGISNVNFTYLDATILQPDPIAIISRGDYINEAKAFIDYILTQRAQNIIGRYRLTIRSDATVTPPRINPFVSDFPSILNYNKTFEEIGKDIITAYYQVWITERYDQEPSIKTAWKEIKEANVTSSYYDLAWNNFTMAGSSINRSYVDTIYNVTNGWTETDVVESYLNEWSNASRNAYNNAIENARLSKENE